MAHETQTRIPQSEDVARPYRVTFFGGGRQWFTTLHEAQRASKQGKTGVIAVWTGTNWAE